MHEDPLENLRQAALQCRRPEITHLLQQLLPSYTNSAEGGDDISKNHPLNG